MTPAATVALHRLSIFDRTELAKEMVIALVAARKGAITMRNAGYLIRSSRGSRSKSEEIKADNITNALSRITIRLTITLFKDF